jgi:hypothetical protein
MQSVGIRQQSSMSTALRYQSNTPSLAERRKEFDELFSEAVRSLRPFALTERERQTVDDAARLRSLSPAGLKTLVAIAARSDRPFILEECIRSAVVAATVAAPAPCLDEANEAETESNHPLNVSQLLWERERTPVRAVGVVEAARQQLHATRILIDVFSLRAFGRKVAV